MNFETLGFVISFVLMYGVLLWFVISHKGWIKTKVMLVLMMTFMTVVNWQSIDSMLGWATTKKLPPKFEVLWVTIKEPSKKDAHDKGGIFLTLKYIDKDDSFSLFNKTDKDEPRLFVVPYSRKKHEQGLKIIGKLNKGERVFGTNKKPGGKGKKGMGNGLYQYKIEGDQMFYDAPPPKKPEKRRQ